MQLRDARADGEAWWQADVVGLGRGVVRDALAAGEARGVEALGELGCLGGTRSLGASSHGALDGPGGTASVDAAE